MVRRVGTGRYHRACTTEINDLRMLALNNTLMILIFFLSWLIWLSSSNSLATNLTVHTNISVKNEFHYKCPKLEMIIIILRLGANYPNVILN